MENSTIAAISTAQAPGGIGIVRISGADAILIADRIFTAFSGAKLTDSAGYRAHYGRVSDADGVIDEAVALVFRAPKSYTGENVVELSCHGGIYLTQQVLRAALDVGARLAEPGEFTRRAFLNGKMGLTAAEAVMDLIGAQGKQAARCALAGREGALQKRIEAIRDEITETAAHLAAWADFPEEEVPEVTEDELSAAFSHGIDALTRLLSQFDAGKALREGVDTVILGRPNVGKSTLMNLLAGCERSIVTDIAGTTRDVVEETVRVGDVLLRLADTAGLRNTTDPVERIGVERARARLQSAGLILAVFDASQPLDDEDRALLAETVGRPAVAVINKSDLNVRIDEAYIKERIQHTVMISAVQQDGLDRLTAAISELLGTAKLDPAEGMLYTERQRASARAALESLTEAQDALNIGMTFDAITVSVERAIESLLELTGERVSDTVVDSVFAQFCVGK